MKNHNLHHAVAREHRRRTVGGSNCVSCDRRDLVTLQNAPQAREFVTVSLMLTGVVDLKRVCNDGFCMAGAGIWASEGKMSDTPHVLQKNFAFWDSQSPKSVSQSLIHSVSQSSSNFPSACHGIAAIATHQANLLWVSDLGNFRRHLGRY